MYLTAGHGGSVADGDIVTDAVAVTDGMRDVLTDAVELADTPLLSETVDDAVCVAVMLGETETDGMRDAENDAVPDDDAPKVPDAVLDAAPDDDGVTGGTLDETVREGETVNEPVTVLEPEAEPLTLPVNVTA